MFNMAAQVSAKEYGYRLVIEYDKDKNKYYLTGYNLRIDQYKVMHSFVDGTTLEFPTMESAIRHIER